MSTRLSRFSVAMSKCAIALAACAFCVEPLIAQESDWPYSHGNEYGQRYISLDQITPANVSQLTKAWAFNTGTNPGGQDIEANPIEVNGIVYFPDGLMNVFAVNASTGKQVWKYTAAASLGL